MAFELADMEVVALIGLLGIASLAAWTSAALWRRQRLLEQELAALAERLESQQTEAPREPEAAEDPSAALAELVAALKATDRDTLETMLRPAFDLPRLPAIDIDGARSDATEPARWGRPGQRRSSGWEA